jgi:hypothetical protein
MLDAILTEPLKGRSQSDHSTPTQALFPGEYTKHHALRDCRSRARRCVERLNPILCLPTGLTRPDLPVTAVAAFVNPPAALNLNNGAAVRTVGPQVQVRFCAVRRAQSRGHPCDSVIQSVPDSHDNALCAARPSQMVAELGDMVGMRTKPKIADSIVDLIGNTPLLKLGRSVEGCDATILAKLESFEPCNSVKDRIGYSMITEAERRGEITPGKQRRRQYTTTPRRPHAARA